MQLSNTTSYQRGIKSILLSETMTNCSLANTFAQAEMENVDIDCYQEGDMFIFDLVKMRAVIVLKLSEFSEDIEKKYEFGQTKKRREELVAK